MKRIFGLMLLILLTTIGWAQKDIKLTTEEYGSLKISDVLIESTVNGRLSETVMELTFYNHTNRVLSGELYIPLPEGATVNGFGLDVNGKMVDGVIVEKNRGRQVFETIQRQGIDPGLLEQTVGNNFKTRVFPLPAKGYRTVRLSYVHALPELEGQLTYLLPLDFERKVDTFSLDIEVVKPGSVPGVSFNGIGNVQTVPVRDSYIISTEQKNVTVNGQISVTLPAVDRNNLTVETSEDGSSYFVYFQEVQSSITTRQTNPDSITLYWDASGSMNATKIDQGINFLKRLFTKWGNLTVELVVVRDSHEQAGKFVVNRGNASALLTYLENLDYDGASSLKDLPDIFPANDLKLLVSDGLSNFGMEKHINTGQIMHTAAVGQGADYTYLKFLAYSNGGVFVNLAESTSVQAAEEIANPAGQYSLGSISGNNSEEQYPASQLPRNNMLVFAGRFSGSTILNIKNPDGKSEQIRISDSNATAGELARTFFGQQKLSQLLLDPDAAKKDIIETGRQFSLATPSTSFIVLDSAEQYVEYDIVPPVSMPEWRTIYFNAKRNVEKEIKEASATKLEQMLALWQQRVEWWKTEFNFPKNYKHSEYSESEDSYYGAEESAMVDEGYLYDEMNESEPEMRAMEESASGSADRIMADAEMEQQMNKSDTRGNTADAISINEWDPDTPYLNAIKRSTEPYATYLEYKDQYGDAPSFYLDCGDYFEKQGEINLAVRIWSNIAEMELENPQLLRNLAHRLQQADQNMLSEAVFRTVLELRPEEPQSYRDLALVLADLQNYEEAIELLYEVVKTPWDRFAEIELIALVEMNNIIATSGISVPRDLGIDQRFIQNLDTDVRVILTWDADLTDMDLWVTEPSGEKAYYGNRSTFIGGNFSRDFTNGYGPEEYMLRKAMPGTYKIETNYYSSSALTLAGTVTLQVDIFTNYGRANQKKESITIRLTDQEETVFIGDVKLN